MMQTDEVTGVVTVALEGISFRFRASLARMAEFQSQTGVLGLKRLLALIDGADQQTVHLGLKALCTSGNEALLDNMLAGRMVKVGPEILITAISAGMEVATPENTPNGGVSQTTEEVSGKLLLDDDAQAA